MGNNIIGGFGVTVIPGYKPHVSQTGVVRWSGMYQCLEVMGEGNDWHILDNGSQTSIGLQDNVISAIVWVQKKQVEEARIKELCEKHKGLKDLKEKFEIMLALVQEHEQNGDK